QGYERRRHRHQVWRGHWQGCRSDQDRAARPCAQHQDQALVASGAAAAMRCCSLRCGAHVCHRCVPLLAELAPHLPTELTAVCLLALHSNARLKRHPCNRTSGVTVATTAASACAITSSSCPSTTCRIPPPRPLLTTSRERWRYRIP